MSNLTKEQKEYMVLEREQIVSALKSLQDRNIEHLSIEDAIKFIEGKPILEEIKR
jgi:CRISPR/Cas system type I-B associated protein Csh2 (Cas7 group RAMP superfamily)